MTCRLRCYCSSTRLPSTYLMNTAARYCTRRHARLVSMTRDVYLVTSSCARQKNQGDLRLPASGWSLRRMDKRS